VTQSRIVRLQESTERFSPVAPRALKLVQQFALAPRRFAPRIPLVENPKRVRIREQKAADQPAACPERRYVAVLARDRRGQRGQISTCPLDDIR
jgi:hypothetical protein